MGNCFSTSQRRCGLCYFDLDEESAILKAPLVQRLYTWRKASHIHNEERTESLDEQLPFPLPEAWHEFLRIQIRTKLEIFRVSRERGCRGCDSIVKAMESACQDDGVVLDDKSWEEGAQVTWTMPSGRDKDLSNLKMEVTVNVSGRDAQSRGTEAYRLWTILIDVDGMNGHEKEQGGKLSNEVQLMQLEDFNNAQAIYLRTDLQSYLATLEQKHL